MAIKTILCAASGGTASDGAIELACRLAKRLGAHIEGFHVRRDPHEFVAMLASDGHGMGMVATESWVRQMAANAQELAAKTKASFNNATGRHGLSSASRDASPATWYEETGYGPVLVAQRARFFDMAILGRSERVVELPHSDAVEETLLHSGRPVLLAPAEVPVACGEVIAVGWNGSTQAVRALAASLPLLAAAKRVFLITVGNDEAKMSAMLMIEYLARHAIPAKSLHVEPVLGVGAGQQLLAATRDQAADLLVMGGYGQMPWRQFLFGGATREIVGVSLLPVLLSH